MSVQSRARKLSNITGKSYQQVLNDLRDLRLRPAADAGYVEVHSAVHIEERVCEECTLTFPVANDTKGKAYGAWDSPFCPACCAEYGVGRCTACGGHTIGDADLCPPCRAHFDHQITKGDPAEDVRRIFLNWDGLVLAHMAHDLPVVRGVFAVWAIRPTDATDPILICVGRADGKEGVRGRLTDQPDRWQRWCPEGRVVAFTWAQTKNATVDDALHSLSDAECDALVNGLISTYHPQANRMVAGGYQHPFTLVVENAGYAMEFKVEDRFERGSRVPPTRKLSMGWSLSPDQVAQLWPDARKPVRTAWNWRNRDGELVDLAPNAKPTLQRWLDRNPSVKVLWPFALRFNFGVPRKVDLTEGQKRAVATWLGQQPISAIKCARCGTAHALQPNSVAWYPLLEMQPTQPSPLVVVASCGTCLGDGEDFFAWLDADATGLAEPRT